MDSSAKERYIETKTMSPKRSSKAAPFGELLRKARLSSGLSQAALASRATISTSLVALMELGKREPKRDKVLAIAKALNLGSAEKAQLLLSAGHAPGAPECAGGAIPETALQQVINELLNDPRLSAKQKLIAESLLEIFVKWLRDELSKGQLHFRFLVSKIK